jgi:hypothetical protein
LVFLCNMTAFNEDCLTHALVQSQSQAYFTTGHLPPISFFWRQTGQTPWDSWPDCF